MEKGSEKRFLREGAKDRQGGSGSPKKANIFYLIPPGSRSGRPWPFAAPPPKMPPPQGGHPRKAVGPRPSSPGDPLTFEDLAVGAAVPIHGRTYRLVDCDPFTRRFYDALVCPNKARPLGQSSFYKQIGARLFGYFFLRPLRLFDHCSVGGHCLVTSRGCTFKPRWRENGHSTCGQRYAHPHSLFFLCEHRMR